MSYFELFNLPSDVPKGDFIGHVAIAVDVLRAGTTISAALNSGAASVFPCVDVESAKSMARQFYAGTEDAQPHAVPPPKPLLGGERHGVLIEGFDLSNSPSDYHPTAVSKRPIVFTTTNGTLAIDACRSADTVLVGSFCNLSAVANAIDKSQKPVSVVCAGTDGHPTIEDILFGGALLQRLTSKGWSISNTAAQAACQIWELAERQMSAGKTLAQILGETQGGKNLLALNLEADIEYASVIDRFDEVPVFDSESGAITCGIDSDVDHSGRHR